MRCTIRENVITYGTCIWKSLLQTSTHFLVKLVLCLRRFFTFSNFRFSSFFPLLMQQFIFHNDKYILNRCHGHAFISGCLTIKWEMSIFYMSAANLQLNFLVNIYFNDSNVIYCEWSNEIFTIFTLCQSLLKIYCRCNILHASVCIDITSVICKWKTSEAIWICKI